jgi:hypothetical protein
VLVTGSGAITCISDFQVAPKWDEADANSRETRLKLAFKTLLGLEVSGKLRSSNVNDATYTTIIAAITGDTQLDLMILNGGSTTNGVTGFRASFQLFDATEDQGLGAVVYDQVVLKPTPNVDGNYNTVLVASGAAAFTAI